VKTRVSRLLPVLLGAGALGSACASWSLTLTSCCMAVLLAAVGPRFDVDAGRQMLSSAIGAGAGYVSASLLYEAESGQLGDGWAKLGAAALIAAAARAVLREPRGGYLPSLALVFAAVVASGRTQNASYVAFVVPFLASGLWALSVPTGPVRWVPSARRFWVGTALVAIASLLGVGTTVGLRRLHAWAQGRARYTATDWRPQVGFSDQMDLGSLAELLDSDKRVLRVRGSRVDYLRGASLDLYESGRWLRSDAAQTEVPLELGSLPAGGAYPAIGDAALGSGVHATAAASEGATGEGEQASAQPHDVEVTSIAARPRRFFVPLDAHIIFTAPGAVLVDGLGAIKPRAKVDLLSVRFSPGARDRAPLSPPQNSDLQLTRRLRERIQALAEDWARGALTPEAKLQALETRLLSDYSYSRSFDRPRGTDPVLDFLFRHKRGHCEYFATALALTARALGIPTRVAMGYRVGERSPFGYYVVRERNAHAWVEAWLPGKGWTTHDATPADGQAYNREHEAGYTASSVDALGVAYDDLTDWLAQRTLEQTSVAWLVGCVVLALIVARGARRRARERSAAEDETLLPFMRPLLTRLERTGHPRRPTEPLEHLAARLHDTEAGRLIRRYTALRYGGIGDARALSEDVAACAKALRQSKETGERQGS
jgi:transglutaminase-like putative cysteine protease